MNFIFVPANESAIARFLHHIFLIDHFFFFFHLFHNTSSPFHCFSRCHYRENIFQNMFSEKKKKKKENRIIGTNTLFKICYIYPIFRYAFNFVNRLYSSPFYGTLIFFDSFFFFESLFLSPFIDDSSYLETFVPAVYVTKVTVGSETRRAKFMKKCHPFLFRMRRSISIREVGSGHPTRISIKPIARRIDHSISFDVR